MPCGPTSSPAMPSPGRCSPPCSASSRWRSSESAASNSPDHSPTWRSRVTPLAKLLEAALFASARPIPTEELAALDAEASKAAIAAALDELREHYDVDGHGVELVEIGGGWQILTSSGYDEADQRA